MTTRKWLFVAGSLLFFCCCVLHHLDFENALVLSLIGLLLGKM